MGAWEAKHEAWEVYRHMPDGDDSIDEGLAVLEAGLRAAYAAGWEAGLGESVGILQGIPVESGEKRRVIWTAIAALEAVRGAGAGKETG